jgi:hypothetical protein
MARRTQVQYVEDIDGGQAEDGLFHGRQRSVSHPGNFG